MPSAFSTIVEANEIYTTEPYMSPRQPTRADRDKARNEGSEVDSQFDALPESDAHDRPPMGNESSATPAPCPNCHSPDDDRCAKTCPWRPHGPAIGGRPRRCRAKRTVHPARATSGVSRDTTRPVDPAYFPP